MLMDERDAERAARKALEKKNKELVPVMNMFSHGNMITFPEFVETRVDANNFELCMTLIQRVEQTPFAGRAAEDANRQICGNRKHSEIKWYRRRCHKGKTLSLFID